MARSLKDMAAKAQSLIDAGKFEELTPEQQLFVKEQLVPRGYVTLELASEKMPETPDPTPQDASFFDNVKTDGQAFYDELAHMLGNPMETMEGMANLTFGAIDKMMPEEMQVTPDGGAAASAAYDHIKQNSVLGAPAIAIENMADYWLNGGENLQQFPDYGELLYEKPVHGAMDIATMLTPVAKGAQVAGLGKTAQVAGTASKVLDPIYAATKVVEPVAKGIGKGYDAMRNLTNAFQGAITGTGQMAKRLQGAYREGGERLAAVQAVEAMLKQPDGKITAIRAVGNGFNDLVDDLVRQKQVEHGQGLAQIVDTGVAVTADELVGAYVDTMRNDMRLADEQFVNGGKLNKEIQHGTFSSSKTKSQIEEMNSVLEEVDLWKGLREINKSTAPIEKLDGTLKQLSSIARAAEPGSQRQIMANRLRQNLINVVDDKLKAVDGYEGPMYGNLSNAYRDKIGLAHELQKAFGSGGVGKNGITRTQAKNMETQFNKFWNTVRQDKDYANALFDELENVGGQYIPIRDQIAALSSVHITPQGWSGKWPLMALMSGGGGGLAAGAAVGANTAALVATPVLLALAVSPKVQGSIAKMMGVSEGVLKKAVEGSRAVLAREIATKGVGQASQANNTVQQYLDERGQNGQ